MERQQELERLAALRIQQEEELRARQEEERARAQRE